MIFYKKISTAIALIILCSSMILAQGRSGQVRGVVTDATTDDALFGANVWLDGTSLGAATSFDGDYLIQQVPPGSYTLIVRYIGYQTQNIPLTLTAGQTMEINIELSAEVIEGEVVTVTAQALGQKQAINQQLSSKTISNIVSSEKIRQLPDANAATALSRLPGLSLMNGDQVVIRGIQASQNLVLVNGIQLPSTDVNTRATNLGFVSSNMLAGIEVIKVVTPDMDANTIGGVVNLRLIEAPTGWHGDILTQGGLNHQERTWGNYKFWGSVSNRFFDDKLGVFIQGNADRSDGGQDRTSAGYVGADNSIHYGEEHYLMNTFTFNDQVNINSSFGGSVLLDYKLPHGKIVLQNTISSGINDNVSHNYQLDFQNTRLIYGLNRDKYKRKLISNALQTEYTFGDIKGELTLSHSYSDRNTDIRYGDAGDATNFANPSNPAIFGLDEEGRRITYSSDDKRAALTPDMAKTIYADPEDYKGAAIADWAVIREVAFKQHIYNASLDFSIPVSFSKGFSSIFKVGGKFVRTTRSNDLNRWYKRTGDETFYTNVRDFIPGKVLSNTNKLLFTDIQDNGYDQGQYFLEGAYPFNYAFDVERLDDFYTRSRTGWGQAIHLDGTVRFDFHGAEIFSAGYLMGTFNFGEKLTLIAGGRYEFYNMKYNATNFYCTHPVDGNGKISDTLNTVDRNDNNFFPNVQVRYKFSDWVDLRLAYSSTISRPDYQAILPSTYYSPGVNNQAGNPNLKPQLSTNFDAYLSLYNNEIGLFTIGGFYKEIDDVFLQTTIYFRNLSLYNVSFPDSAFWVANGISAPAPSERIVTFVNNPHPAYIRGLEFEWQTNFWYLPAPFSSLVLNINYTRVWSNMDYQQVINTPVSETYIDPVTGRRVTRNTFISTDTTRSARLINQGNDILNIALGFDYKGFSGRISFNMQGNVITTVGGRPETDQFTGNIYGWDFTLKQELPINGLSVTLSGINIFHNPTTTYQRFRRVVDGPIFDNEATKAYSPRRFELNLRYTL